MFSVYCVRVFLHSGAIYTFSFFVLPSRFVLLILAVVISSEDPFYSVYCRIHAAPDDSSQRTVTGLYMQCIHSDVLAAQHANDGAHSSTRAGAPSAKKR